MPTRLTPDLPRREERRGIRHLMIFGAGLAFVLFAVVLGWTFLTTPQGQLGTREQPSPQTGVLSNQGSGVSEAGRNSAVTPRQNPVVGGGPNSSGEAAQIEQSAKPLQLSDAQRQQIRHYFADKPAQRMQSVNFSVTIGAAVPQQLALQKLPAELSSAIGGYQGDDYLLVGDELVIVDPHARRIVAIVPNVG
jgi:hypothetical protein